MLGCTKLDGDLAMSAKLRFAVVAALRRRLGWAIRAGARDRFAYHDPDESRYDRPGEPRRGPLPRREPSSSTDHNDAAQWRAGGFELLLPRERSRELQRCLQSDGARIDVRCRRSRDGSVQRAAVSRSGLRTGWIWGTRSLALGSVPGQRRRVHLRRLGAARQSLGAGDASWLWTDVRCRRWGLQPHAGLRMQVVRRPEDVCHQVRAIAHLDGDVLLEQDAVTNLDRRTGLRST